MAQSARLSWRLALRRACVERGAARAVARCSPRFDAQLAQAPVGADVGVRPIPPDGLPVVGPLDGVEGMYAVVTHSAAHLGPLLGRLLADELAGTPSALLNAFRPQRFDETVPAVEDESFHETRIALADHATG